MRGSNLALVCFVASASIAQTTCASRARGLAPGRAVVTVRASDRDGDGVRDPVDRCPDEAEDCDGFEDEDGCPDRDNDHDGIPDGCDRCPGEPETYNGNDDDDGCPDGCILTVATDEIEIVPQVSFARDRAVISHESMPMLDAVAHAMTAHPPIERVAIVGRAEPDERDAARLAHRRAETVRAALISRGIAPGRLEAFASDARAPDARCVHFATLRVDGRETRRWNGHTLDIVPAPDAPVPIAPRAPVVCTESMRRPLRPPAGGCRAALPHVGAVSSTAVSVP